MTGARARLAAARGAGWNRQIVAALAISVLLHGAGVWWLLPHGGGVREQMAAPPGIEVEMVDQAGAVKGSAAAAVTQPPPPPPSPPLPQQQEAGPPPPPPPAPEAPAGPKSNAAVNLGGDSDEDRDPLLVTGDHVVPPQPDAKIRNKPPVYPAEAARRGAQGTVTLRAHITELGVPVWVDVVASSGDASLDRAAQEAVALWRFQPARNAGVAVPFDYEMNINFTMGGR